MTATTETITTEAEYKVGDMLVIIDNTGHGDPDFVDAPKVGEIMKVVGIDREFGAEDLLLTERASGLHYQAFPFRFRKLTIGEVVEIDYFPNSNWNGPAILCDLYPDEGGASLVPLQGECKDVRGYFSIDKFAAPVEPVFPSSTPDTKVGDRVLVTHAAYAVEPTAGSQPVPATVVQTFPNGDFQEGRILVELDTEVPGFPKTLYADEWEPYVDPTPAKFQFGDRVVYKANNIGEFSCPEFDGERGVVVEKLYGAGNFRVEWDNDTEYDDDGRLLHRAPSTVPAHFNLVSEAEWDAEQVEPLPTIGDVEGLDSLGLDAVIRSVLTGALYVKTEEGRWRFIPRGGRLDTNENMTFFLRDILSWSKGEGFEVLYVGN